MDLRRLLEGNLAVHRPQHVPQDPLREPEEAQGSGAHEDDVRHACHRRRPRRDPGSQLRRRRVRGRDASVRHAASRSTSEGVLSVQLHYVYIETRFINKNSLRDGVTATSLPARFTSSVRVGNTMPTWSRPIRPALVIVHP